MSEQLFHIAATVMSGKGAMHIRDITEAAKEMGASNLPEVQEVFQQKNGEFDLTKATRHCLYHVMLNEINRNSSSGTFARAGRGHFVLVNEYDPTKHKFEGNKTKKSEDRKYEKPKLVTVPEDRRCGNCTFLSFSGPGFLHQQSGACDNQTRSGHYYVRGEQPACPYWKQRTTQQKAADRYEKENDLNELVAFNTGASRVKRKSPLAKGKNKK